MTVQPRRVARLRRFLAAEEGIVAVEAVIWVPVLLSVWIFLFSAATLYQTLIANANSAHTIGDIVSRQTDVLSPDDVAGLERLHRLISQAETDSEADLRLTTLRYDAATEGFTLLDSLASDIEPAMTQDDVNALAAQLPAIPDGDQLIVVETWLAHAPLSGLLDASYRFRQMVTVRPRLAAQVRLVE
jgi:hypothetical protein